MSDPAPNINIDNLWFAPEQVFVGVVTVSGIFPLFHPFLLVFRHSENFSSVPFPHRNGTRRAGGYAETTADAPFVYDCCGINGYGTGLAAVQAHAAGRALGFFDDGKVAGICRGVQ